ncbi:MAG: sulfatase-like hydrolase/transferase [Balneolaceae bacterium]|nr:sulfatase-like hydrolase/transferase [Balneolaceae bacterium]
MEKVQADHNYKLNLLSIWIWSIIILVVSPVNIHAVSSVEVIYRPNIESLAEGGITFDRVFSNSPVCSVARTTVINGVYAPRTATHHHRRIESVKMPTVKKSNPNMLKLKTTKGELQIPIICIHGRM